MNITVAMVGIASALVVFGYVCCAILEIKEHGWFYLEHAQTKEKRLNNENKKT